LIIYIELFIIAGMITFEIQYAHCLDEIQLAHEEI